MTPGEGYLIAANIVVLVIIIGVLAHRATVLKNRLTDAEHQALNQEARVAVRDENIDTLQATLGMKNAEIARQAAFAEDLSAANVKLLGRIDALEDENGELKDEVANLGVYVVQLQETIERLEEETHEWMEEDPS